jgi:GMP synthase (glutamine-hydrolysing)
MSKILVMQHHPGETLGRISEALESAALVWQYVRGYAQQPVPANLKGAEGLIVMGGPQGVYEQDKYPYLRDEIALIRSAIAERKPVLGICLGSQLIAAALDARVAPGPAREMGWYPVRLAPAARDDRLFRGVPEVFTACHWHGDIFDLPEGATALASSEATACQSFRYGDNVHALLFHVEITEPMLRDWVRGSAAELARDRIDGEAILADAPRCFAAIEPIAETIFGNWAAMVRP